MRLDIIERKSEIEQWIKEEQPKSYIAKQLGCKPQTLNSYLEIMGIEYKGQQNKKGQHKGTNIYKPASYYIDNEISISSHKLKEKLIRDKIKKSQCELCGISEWMNVSIPLELHHKDGNHFNNNLDNLQILCPNCHSIQEGNSGANIKSFKEKQKKEVKEKIVNIPNKKQYFCSQCGQEITRSSQSGLCLDCAHKQQRRCERPNREELKNLIRNNPLIKIGEMFGVSDNAVRKWCVAENLPSKSFEIRKISDEDWANI